MGAVKNINLDEKYEFSAKAKKNILITLAVGAALLSFGIFGLSQGWFDPSHVDGGHAAAEHHASINTSDLLASEGHSDAHGAEVEGHGDAGHHGYSWTKRIVTNLWHNNVWFLGISLIGVFFLTVNYLAWAGWNAVFKRVLEAFGYYLPVAFVLTIGLFLAFSHDIFHWTHEGIMTPGSANYDPIIAAKSWWLSNGFYMGRIVFYFVAWIGVFFLVRKHSLLEDAVGGDFHHYKMVDWSGLFIFLFGITSSTGSWDLIMSIDTHWFSTLFGWYAFASWFVSGLCAIVLIIIYLKEAGYLQLVTAEHLHDLGKFMFAFSIFWTYLFFSQFILYWYANIPEEGVWFIERMFNNMGNYSVLFVLNLIINFLFPFLFFMTRDSKREMTLLKVGAYVLLVGHWIDFYLMITPGTLGEHGGMNVGMLFVELGTTLIFTAIFLWSVLTGLSKAPLYAKNHPMLQESINHHT